MNTLEDAKNAVGKKFKLLNADGKTYAGAFGRADTIVTVDERTGNIQGKIFTCHYTDCRLVEEQPAHLKH